MEKKNRPNFSRGDLTGRLLITIQDKEKIKALVETIETKVTIVRRTRHWAVVENEFCRYHHDDGHGYKPLVFIHTELKGEINRMWRNVAETQIN